MKRTITFLLLLSSFMFGQTVLVNWNFDDQNVLSDEGTDGTGLTPYNTNQIIITNEGATINYTDGNPLTGQCLLTRSWSENEYYLITVNTINYSDIYLSFDCYSSSTGPRDFKIQFSTNAIDFYDITNNVFRSPLSFSSTPMFNFSLPNECNNTSNLNLKILCTSNVQADGDGDISSQGTFRIDNISVISELNEPLPVELTTFSASVVDKNVKLNWETATEVNNYGFDIERKSEFGNWNKVGFVQGSGNSNSTKFYNYIDQTINISQKYFYRLKQIDIDGNFEYSDEVVIIFGTPQNFELEQNYPNPFNPITKIKYSIPDNSNLQQKVVLKIYNVLGQVVKTLVNENKHPGIYEIEFNGNDLMSGIYFYKLEVGNFIQMRKMVLTK
ncbi:MAG: T9SS type A sorting domain-containing protein [Ignavibacteriae bacterium]|nr:T9SS type A sorting domain-containing protein [Ignavibacteriota bacterium]